MGTVSNLTVLKIRATFNSGGGSTTYWKGVKVDGVLIDIRDGSTAIDSLTDTQTNYGTDTGLGGEVRGNYATLNPLQKNASDISQGNIFRGNTSKTD